MLSRILAALAPAPAPLAAVDLYCGCAAGWQPVGAPRPIARAEALAALARRVRPQGHYRVRPV